jgi:thiamine transport system permease protein
MGRLGGILALGTVLSVTLVPVLALIALSGGAAPLPGLGPALRFTLLQAGLSAMASVVLALPLARALHRRRFPGRTLAISLMALPFFLPPLVAAMALLALFGRGGPVARAFALVGAEAPAIYGLHGIVLAHVFLNLPLAARLILLALEQIPPAQHRLADSLGLTGWPRIAALELPVLAAALPGAFLLIFLFALSSFGIVLTLGGGPSAANLEVLVYQALRLDFDPGAAGRLALVQCALSLILVLPLWRARRIWRQGAGGRTVPIAAPGGVPRLADAAVIALAALALTLPLGMMVLRGLSGELPRAFLPAALRSVQVALAAAALASLLALGIALAWEGRRRWPLALALLPQAISPLVIGAGLYVLAVRVFDPFALALPLTALVNAAFAVPLILAGLLPALARVRADQGRLADSLGLGRWTRFRLVTWPAIRVPLRFGSGLTAALSIGDFGVIALFAPPEGGTLPLLMQRLMAAYRMADAAAVALAMVILSGTVFLLISGGRGHGHHA